MQRSILHAATVLVALAIGAPAAATTFVFDQDPFAGTTALTTPGRQVVGGEPFISFLPGSDVFAFDPTVFDAGDDVRFANEIAGNLPTSGRNIVVLETFDDDANSGTPFGAGNAANLIAARVTTDGAGFFIYFNSGLNLPRLVYSTNLSDNTADLKILARMTNLSGQSGELVNFSAANFQFLTGVPEPESWALMILGLGLVGGYARRGRAASVEA
ncbi:MAG TPA: PEPxxWA-CTERM sorting domain-containing protein [Phenylobacterium sp.]